MSIGVDHLVPGAIVTGPLLPEPIEVLATVPMGSALKVIGRGLRTNQVHQPVLDAEQVAQLLVSPKHAPFDGDAQRFRLGIEGHRLGLAYEYDPYFSLSIARIDPLPHQLEAVYEYFLKVPRIRFLLADDPGAGKTIMAGLLLKELKTRGLVKRTLIVTPANLTFQWQREMKDKFREAFHVVRGDVLRAGYGSNPWAEHDQVVTSVSWVSRVEDAKESLLRTHWDLIVVDEAHKMSPTFEDKPTLAFQIGQALSERTDHFLLMTATPHKGDPDHFRRFLTLLDRDVYADITSLQEAMKKKSAPFYLRRVKEALVTFPDPETGKVSKLFKKRDVQTAAFDLEDAEFAFYGALTQYVTNQSARAAGEDSPAARALGFTMAMLQRRFASSAYAARRSLERMRERRQRILEDPDKFRKQQIDKALPDDFDELPDEDQQKILTDLENVVVNLDPAQLRSEIQDLTGLVDEARALERSEVESKLNKLREVLKEWGIFDDPKMKLLIFTEHKDTLDYLAGDGKDSRPKGKLQEWGLKVTQIHGGMKIGDRDTPGTRIYAEKEFREGAQVLVATEAAGEGINLQFCWLMINYDIPWNPVRLEQRMGRIHRYGQEHDCLVFNFVAVNTREGRVLEMLLTRLRQIREDLESDKVFDVVGEVFPSNLLEKMFRDLYAGKIGETDIKDRVLSELDPKRFKQITESTLEGLAKRDLNLSAIIGKTAEAKERRLVPEVIEDFATQAGPIVTLPLKLEKPGTHIFRAGKVPKSLAARGPAQESRFGVLAKEYGRIAFDKNLLKDDATLEWVTPGLRHGDPMSTRVVEQIALGVSTRGYERSLEPTDESIEARGASKSNASRALIDATADKLAQFVSRKLDDVDLVAMFIDGIEFAGHSVLIALGVTIDGTKTPLGIWAGSTENTTVVTELLSNLVARGLRVEHSMLFVIDGGKAIRKALRDVFGDRAIVQRCQVHKARNVRDHLPEPRRAYIAKQMRDAYDSATAATAKKKLLQLASWLDSNGHDDAAASLREGLDETLTVMRLGLTGTLRKTFATTNPIENMNGALRRIARNVKRWKDEAMIRRWVALGIAEAQKGFRRVKGHANMPFLVAALRPATATVAPEKKVA